MTCTPAQKYAARRVSREDILKLYGNTVQKTTSYLAGHLSQRDHLFQKDLLFACHLASGILCGMHTKSEPPFPRTLSLINSKYSHFSDSRPAVIPWMFSSKVFIQRNEGSEKTHNLPSWGWCSFLKLMLCLLHSAPKKHSIEGCPNCYENLALGLATGDLGQSSWKRWQRTAVAWLLPVISSSEKLITVNIQ